MVRWGYDGSNLVMDIYDGVIQLIWKQLFTPKILQRGYDYWEQARVQHLQRHADGVTAVVTGSEAYEVTIVVLVDQVTGADCDCPYAATGAYCKHMAAVLYAAEAETSSQTHSVPVATATTSAAELVQQANDEQVRAFLNRCFAQQPGLLTKFKTFIAPDKPATTLRTYQAQIDDFCLDYADESGFIDYEAASEFGNAAYMFFQDEMNDLVQAQQPELAFKVLAYLVEAVCQLEIDDSDGELGMIIAKCEDCWQALLAMATMPLKRSMLKWFCSQLTASNDLFGDTFETIIFENFSEPELLTIKLAFTRQHLQVAQKLSDEWERDYQTEKWAAYQLATMIALTVPVSEIKAVCQQYEVYFEVRKVYVQWCLTCQDEAAAVEVLLRSKQLDRDRSDHLIMDSRTLAAIYRRQQSPAYSQELEALLTQYAPGDLDTYQLLKGQFSTAAWPAKREQVFSELPANTDLKPLYAFDQLDDRLLAAVLADAGLGSLTTYESQLKPKYSRELLRKYAHEVEKMAVPTTNRKFYRHLVSLLKRMKTYPGGPTITDHIVSDWRQRYVRRSAMMDELKDFW